ncbi:hypothetical protein [Blastococcus brunescens]|uniref:Uncharacterized protein n=1 Tax=Blastococcus brunescens TaxID=1564165 RepID=A0ABZ1B4A3_9ACTN|nr:hypothetical protein [Blastococcus sp. BMG 8361]WRL65621.1 hypothetical protein U6N30_08590 [Blastococcus sp. BMG 8361]
MTAGGLLLTLAGLLLAAGLVGVVGAVRGVSFLPERSPSVRSSSRRGPLRCSSVRWPPACSSCWSLAGRPRRWALPAVSCSFRRCSAAARRPSD